MAYSDDITNLSPDHRWKFDGNVGTDDVGAVTATMTGSASGTAICEDVTNCAQTNTIAGDRFSLANTTTISNLAQSRKAVGGWFAISKINLHPVRIYGEGNTNTFQFVMALGNNVMLEVIESGNFILQSFGIALVPDRPYHLFGLLSGSGYDDKVEFFIDGISQGSVAMGDTELSSRTPAEFADPSGTVVVGGTTVLLQAPTNGFYNQWAAWSNKSLPTATEIREELFEKGALPDVTIVADNLGIMQNDFDDYDNTTRPNAPLCIRVEEPSAGNGDLTLDATNMIFDDLASIHIQWMGTGTLTINKIGTSNPSIFSTPNGGTVETSIDTTVTVTVKDADTLATIEDARVFIEDEDTNVILNTLTDSSGEATVSYTHIEDKLLTGKVRKGSVAPFYKTSTINETITENGIDITILMVKD